MALQGAWTARSLELWAPSLGCLASRGSHLRACAGGNLQAPGGWVEEEAGHGVLGFE
jgi:hypothetical protein